MNFIFILYELKVHLSRKDPVARQPYSVEQLVTLLKLAGSRVGLA